MFVIDISVVAFMYLACYFAWRMSLVMKKQVAIPPSPPLFNLNSYSVCGSYFVFGWFWKLLFISSCALGVLHCLISTKTCVNVSPIFPHHPLLNMTPNKTHDTQPSTHTQHQPFHMQVWFVSPMMFNYSPWCPPFHLCWTLTILLVGLICLSDDAQPPLWFPPFHSCPILTVSLVGLICLSDDTQPPPWCPPFHSCPTLAISLAGLFLHGKVISLTCGLNFQMSGVPSGEEVFAAISVRMMGLSSKTVQQAMVYYTQIGKQ